MDNGGENRNRYSFANGSQTLQLEVRGADNTERKSDSRTGRKLIKVDVVVENCGGGASIVVARRRSVLEVSMSRKSEAVKDGVSRGREGLPSIPEMEDHRRFGFFMTRNKFRIMK